MFNYTLSISHGINLQLKNLRIEHFLSTIDSSGLSEWSSSLLPLIPNQLVQQSTHRNGYFLHANVLIAAFFTVWKFPLRAMVWWGYKPRWVNFACTTNLLKIEMALSILLFVYSWQKIIIFKIYENKNWSLVHRLFS